MCSAFLCPLCVRSYLPLESFSLLFSPLISLISSKVSPQFLVADWKTLAFLDILHFLPVGYLNYIKIYWIYIWVYHVLNILIAWLVKTSLFRIFLLLALSWNLASHTLHWTNILCLYKNIEYLNEGEKN